MRKFFLKLRKRRRLERDLDEELEFHRRLSERHFGNLTRIREDARELWTFPYFENVLRDFRYACRVLAKSPSYSLVSLLTLSLGIGINTAVFTLYDSLTYRLLPVQAPEELVRVVHRSGNGIQPASVSYAEFEGLRNGLKGIADVIASSSSQTVPGALAPATSAQEGIKAQFVTGDYWKVLGITCPRGRAFKNNERAVAVVSYPFWTRRLNGDRLIAGKSITLAGAPVMIVGVAPKGFYGIDLPPRIPDLWLPLAMQAGGTTRTLHVLARRKPGVTIEQVSGKMRSLGLAATDATAFQTNMGAFRGTGTISLILMGAVGVILLIGCVNLVNLTLSRNAARTREIAVRLAIGATQRRIVQQLCTETFVLALGGGVLGLALSRLLCYWIRLGALAALDRISNELLGGFQLDVTPDWRVFAFTLGLAVVTAAGVGIWPALGSIRTNLNSSLKREGLRRGQRHLLLTAQIAACFLLLTGAGLLLRGTWQSRSADPGFGLDRILIMNMDLTVVDGTADERAAVLRRVLDQIRSLPEVTSLALVDRSPFLGTGAGQFESDNHNELRCRFNGVSSGYFNTLNVPILAGRTFSKAETEEDAAEVVVSEAAARSYWGNRNPIGQRVAVDSRSRIGFRHSFYTVVGVSKVVRNTFLSKEDKFYLYFPKPVSDAGGWVLMRTRQGPEQAMPAVRSALLRVNPAMAAHAYLISLKQGPVQIQKLMTDIPGTVALTLGVLGLLLASIGVYGVVMYLVTQRIRVIGIHLALGAQRVDVIWLILREGLGCVAQGTLIGLCGATCLSAVLAWVVKSPDLPDLTYQAGVFDPITFVVSLMALAVAVGAACVWPVYRATRVDPATVLRSN